MIGIPIPSRFRAEEIAPPAGPSIPIEEAARRALRAPIGSPPLAELARGRRDAVIAIPDASRPLSAGPALRLLLAELAAGGVPPERTTVVVALGLHARPPEAELAAFAGAPPGVRVVAHDPLGPLSDFGVGPGGAPLRLSKLCADADLLLSLGLVEPHQYAGFSGGYKTVAIGCGSEAIIAATHSPAFVLDPRCRPGNLADNPFQAVLRAAGQAAGHAFALNLIPRGPGAAAAAAGEPGAVLAALAARAAEVCAVYRGPPADAALAIVPPPKDRNFYQASRGVTNLVCGAVPAVREGGAIVLVAGAPDGPGEGVGERRFAALFRQGVPAILARETAGLLGGEQRAFLLARAIKKRVLILAGAAAPDLLAGFPIRFAADAAEGLRIAEEATGGGRLLLFPDAIETLTLHEEPPETL